MSGSREAKLLTELAETQDQRSSLLATNYDLRKERDRLTDELAEALARQSCDNGKPYICHALATARSELAEARASLRDSRHLVAFTDRAKFAHSTTNASCSPASTPSSPQRISRPLLQIYNQPKEAEMTTVDSTSDERTVNNVMRHQYRDCDAMGVENQSLCCHRQASKAGGSSVSTGRW